MKTKTLYIMTIRAILAVGLTLLASTSCQGQVKTTETSGSGASYSKTEFTDKQDVIPLPATDGEWLTRNTDGSFIYQPTPSGTDNQNAIEVPFTPEGSITAINTQAAIQEVRDEAHPLMDSSSPVFTLSGVDMNFGQSYILPAISSIYSNGTSGLTATNVQAAIDELAGYKAPANNSLNGLVDFTVTNANIYSGASKIINQLNAPETIVIELANVNVGEVDIYNFDVIDAFGQLDFNSTNGFVAKDFGSNDYVRLTGIGSVDFIETGINTGVFKIFSGDGVSYEVNGAVPVVESFTSNWGNGVTPASVNKPTGVQTNDLLVIMVSDDQADTATASFDQTDAPVGFAFVTEAGDAVSDTHLGIYYRISDGTEGASFSVSLQGNDFSISCLRISGVDLIDPIGIVGTSQSEGSSTSIAIPGITTALDNSLIIGVASTDGSDVDYSSLAGSGWVYGGSAEGLDSSDNTNSTWVNKGMPTAGATGSPTVSFASQDGLVGLQFEIKSQ